MIRLLSIDNGAQSASIEIGGNIASTPAVVGSRLFLGTMNESVVGIDWKKAQIVWTFRNPERAFPSIHSPAVFAD